MKFSITEVSRCTVCMESWRSWSW